ncbi:MAG: (2Fe-2S)-binding protein [Thermomicrobiales bacterium]
MAEGQADEHAGISETMICRCEELAASEIVSAIASGALSLNDVKRRTRAGMGACQGIFCLPAITALVAEAAGVPVQQVAPMTSRPPTRTVRLEILADLVPESDAEVRSREG